MIVHMNSFSRVPRMNALALNGFGTAGSTTSTTPSSQGFDWGSLIGTVVSTAGGVVSSIFGKGGSSQDAALQAQLMAQQQAQAQTANMIKYLAFGAVGVGGLVVLSSMMNKGGGSGRRR